MLNFEKNYGPKTKEIEQFNRSIHITLVI
uniref:Uncharacterized protein n=1 Tax=Heterorhabditis bacteriophora TaxID=37862 RepID=A0A1I7WHP9_HETBA